MFDVYVLPFALVVSAAVLIAAAVRRALHNAADATTPEAIQAAMQRHPSTVCGCEDGDCFWCAARTEEL